MCQQVKVVRRAHGKWHSPSCFQLDVRGRPEGEVKNIFRRLILKCSHRSLFQGIWFDCLIRLFNTVAALQSDLAEHLTGPQSILGIGHRFAIFLCSLGDDLVGQLTIQRLIKGRRLTKKNSYSQTCPDVPQTIVPIHQNAAWNGARLEGQAVAEVTSMCLGGKLTYGTDSMNLSILFGASFISNLST